MSPSTTLPTTPAANRLSAATRAKLATVSTATSARRCSSAACASSSSRTCGRSIRAAGPMVGEAFTLRYIPAREDLNPITVFHDRTHPQRRAVEECPPGAVSRHRQPQGCAGRVGGVDPRCAVDEARRRRRRDRRRLPRLAGNRAACHSALTITARAAPTNLTLHQALDINVPIGCGDAPVFPGDVIVGDAEGVVVVPGASRRPRSPTRPSR